MTRSLHLAGLCSGLLLLPVSALADPEEPFAVEQDDGYSAEEPDWVVAQDVAVDEASPPATVAPPPSATVPVRPPVTPPGEWVETDQYGRIWMPYDDVYTSVPFDGYGEPLQYVYYPAYGWTWVAAPWIWGWGPFPVISFYGRSHAGWYCHGWWRTPSRWSYAPSARFGGYSRGSWQGTHRGGLAAPQRGFGGFRSLPAPHFRGAAPGFRAAAPGNRGAALPSFGGRSGGGWGRSSGFQGGFHHGR